jgi:glycosyltransferase involved in cell wall biosynthesis
VTEATILVPTFRHPLLLPYALRSALAQEGVTFEIFVVGDGVEDDTRAAIEPFLADSRVRFFDFPKGERHGERNRHEALKEARGEIVCYVSDDDLLLPGYLVEMRHLLGHADLAHCMPVSVHPDGRVVYRPADLGRPAFLAMIRGGEINFFSLTGAGHTRAAYDRLEGGWLPAPPPGPTDLHMWRRFADLPGFRGATGSRLTALNFPDPAWRDVAPPERAAVLARWLDLALAPEAAEDLDRVLVESVALAAQDLNLRSMELSRALDKMKRERDGLRSALERRPRALGGARRLARRVMRSRQR